VVTAAPGPAPEPLPGARLLFSLDPTQSYLNHGHAGVTPIPVQRAHQRLREEMEANPQRFYTRGLFDRLAHVRRHLAEFVGADPNGAALVPNTTFGVGIVLHTLGLGAGDEVVTTSHGYGAVDHAADATGARRRVVPLSLAAEPAEIVATVRNAVNPSRTKLVIVDLVTSSTARLLPVAEIVQALRGTGVPVLVDAAHGPGALPLAVDALGADFFVGTLHKWAFAPRSTAILVVAEPWRDRIRPVVVSWSQPDGYPARVEHAGTLDYTGWLAAPSGLFALRTLGVDRVRAHNAALARYGQQVVGNALGLTDLPDPGGALPMRLIPLPADGDLAAAVRLRERISDELRAEVAVTAWNGRLLLRLCAQIYNRPEEYDRLAEWLPKLLR
jgi:isopenicillin-N epimerase